MQSSKFIRAIGKDIRIERNNKNISFVDLAKKSGVNKRKISDFEREGLNTTFKKVY
ncbi:unnamed protein product [marine sediment metagenome]|uniref:HTH cro/C1-type domain-containing protein n=1 Tax=marine sediment metagenome TaxID=412755 RepID=X0ZKR8_9ZZZZ